MATMCAKSSSRQPPPDTPPPRPRMWAGIHRCPFRRAHNSPSSSQFAVVRFGVLAARRRRIHNSPVSVSASSQLAAHPAGGELPTARRLHLGRHIRCTLPQVAVPNFQHCNAGRAAKRVRQDARSNVRVIWPTAQRHPPPARGSLRPATPALDHTQDATAIARQDDHPSKWPPITGGTPWGVTNATPATRPPVKSETSACNERR